MEQKEIDNLLQVISDGGFVRIAKAIRILWGEKDCDRYLNDLIVDDRGNRQGFPKEVLSAIMKLSVEHHKKFSSTTYDVWTSVPANKEKFDKEWTSNRVADTQPPRFQISPLTLLILMGSAWLLWKVYFSL